ncbi:hypothetical protein PALB_32010 [Pseudoalteromonas luteoviolacea B = ATCC 29581]|nr:hypothetical protein PALB_32010 [Pseudoalteromonas luteoviolacea B = ATCC 29581]
MSIGALFFSVFPTLTAAQESEIAEVPIESSPIDLTPYTAEYNVLRKGKIHGKATRELEKVDENTYLVRYTSNIKWMIFSDDRKEETTFTLNNDQVHPETYLMERVGTGPDKSYNVVFDKNKKSIVHSEKEYPLTVEWRDDWQDLLSYQTQLRLDIKAGKTQFSYPIIDKDGDERNYAFEVIGTETITLPIGNFETIKVKRVYDNDKRQVFVWFAPSLDYMLVQLFKGKDGVEQFQIQLKSFNNSEISL